MTEDAGARLEELFSGRAPRMTSDEARERFGDYGALVLQLAVGASEKVVRDLCRIVTPVSSNLLHLVAAMGDTTSTRLVEVPYDLEHPNGEDVVVTVHHRDRQRAIARNELAARGHPAYDPDAYRSPGCWRLPPTAEG